MSKQRMINTKFWSDPWVMTKLNPLDRLLFLYLITNELTNISGIYEISEHRIAFDTGIERDTLLKSMIPRLEPKAYYIDNWIILTNFTKHQNLKSKDVVLGIQREFQLAPKVVQDEAIRRGWGEGLGMMPDTKPNLTKPNSLNAEAFTVTDELEVITPPRNVKYPHKEEVYALWPKRPLNWNIAAPQCKAAENLYKERGISQIKSAIAFWLEHKDEQFCPDCSTPYKLDSNWSALFKFKARNNL